MHLSMDCVCPEKKDQACLHDRPAPLGSGRLYVTWRPLPSQDVLVSVKEEMQAIRAGGGRVARAKPLTGKVPYVATGVGYVTSSLREGDGGRRTPGLEGVGGICWIAG